MRMLSLRNFPEFEKLTRHQGHAGTLPRRFLLEQDDDPTDDEVASMGCVRHWHSARVGPRSEWRLLDKYLSDPKLTDAGYDYIRT